MSCTSPQLKLEDFPENCYAGLNPAEWMERPTNEVVIILKQNGYVEKNNTTNEIAFRNPTTGKTIRLYSGGLKKDGGPKVIGVYFHWAHDKACFDAFKKQLQQFPIDGIKIDTGIYKWLPDTTYYYSDENNGYFLSMTSIGTCCPPEVNYERSNYHVNIYWREDYDKWILPRIKKE